MQWTREGAHSVLQIRGQLISNEWNGQWQKPVLAALGVDNLSAIAINILRSHDSLKSLPQADFFNYLLRKL